MDYSNKKNLHNWIERLDLVCKTGDQIGFLGSAVFGGWVLTALVIPPLADKFGRAPVYLFTITASFMIYIYSLFFANSLNIMIGMMFLVGMLTPGRGAVGYVLGCEHLTHDQ